MSGVKLAESLKNDILARASGLELLTSNDVQNEMTEGKLKNENEFIRQNHLNHRQSRRCVI